MTSRERIRCAINHKEPDRVPVDIAGTNVTGIHVAEYIELIRYLGLDAEPAKVYDPFQFLARPDDIVRRVLRTDVIELENFIEKRWGCRNENWKFWDSGNGYRVLVPGDFSPVRNGDYWDIPDRSGKPIGRMPYGGLYFERVCETGTTDDLTENLMSPEDYYRSIPLYTDEELKILERRAKLLYENTDYSIHGNINNLKLFTAGLIAGQTISNWLCLLLIDEDYCYSILEAAAERAIENIRLYLEAVGKYIDTMLLSTSDYGSQNGEFFSPEIFRKLYMPNIKKVNDFVHANSSVKTMYHSCGSIANIIEYMVEAGVDILNPIQLSCRNMDARELKAKYGDRLVFWGGGVDTQTVMQHGTPEEVRAQVRERIEIFAPGGGFVFAPVHNLQYGVPVENIMAMLDELQKHSY
ncbi:MAG: uroporphyrinogen decarboxylase family protein [Eubacteriales bacterium]